MVIPSYEWKDEYNIGVNVVDTAHQYLFKLVAHLAQMLEADDYEQNKKACDDAIKRLYKYTETHFQQEEEYMKSINYASYEIHKALHDNLRENTVPALDKELKEKDYSKEAIEKFAGIFSGWLAGHILIEDRAISGKVKSRYNLPDKDRQQTLIEQVVFFFRDICHTECQVFNKLYAGEAFNSPVIVEMKYKGQQSKQELKVYFNSEEKLILHVVGMLLGAEYDSLNKATMFSYLQLISSFGRSVLNIMHPEDDYVYVSGRSITEEDLNDSFKTKVPETSVAWKSDAGYLAISIDN